MLSHGADNGLYGTSVATRRRDSPDDSRKLYSSQLEELKALNLGINKILRSEIGFGMPPESPLGPTESPSQVSHPSERPENSKLRSSTEGFPWSPTTTSPARPGSEQGFPDSPEKSLRSPSAKYQSNTSMIPRVKHDAVLQEFRRLMKEMEMMVPKAMLDAANAEIQRLTLHSVPKNQFNTLKLEMDLLHQILSECLHNVVPVIEPEPVRELLSSLIGGILPNAAVEPGGAKLPEVQQQAQERPEATAAGDHSKARLEVMQEELHCCKGELSGVQEALGKATQDRQALEVALSQSIKDRQALQEELDELKAKLLLDSPIADDNVVPRELLDAAQEEVRQLSFERATLCQEIEGLLRRAKHAEGMVPRERYDKAKVHLHETTRERDRLGRDLQDAVRERQRLTRELQDAVRRLGAMVPKEQVRACVWCVCVFVLCVCMRAHACVLV